MNETKPSGQGKGMNKPVVGLVIVMIVATLLGAWLYVQSVRNDLEMKISALSGQVSAATEAMPQEPAPNTKMFRSGKYTFDYPADWEYSLASTYLSDNLYSAHFWDSTHNEVARFGCAPWDDAIVGMSPSQEKTLGQGASSSTVGLLRDVGLHEDPGYPDNVMTYDIVRMGNDCRLYVFSSQDPTAADAAHAASSAIFDSTRLTQ